MYAQIPSPNFSNKTIVPRFIVVHYTASRTASSAINWMANPASKVSAHLVITRNGKVTQMVEFDKKAWHAGPSSHSGWGNLNDCSIGIELVNTGSQAYPQAQMSALKEVIESLRCKYSTIFAIVGHDEIDTETNESLRKTDPGPLFPWKDFRICEEQEVFEVIPARLNIRSGPTTSSDIDGVVKRGDEIVILGRADDWVRFHRGFLHTNYIRRIS